VTTRWALGNAIWLSHNQMALPICLCACHARGPKFDPRGGSETSTVTISLGQTLVSSVCYASSFSASADRDFKPGSKCWGLQYSPTLVGKLYIFIQGHTLHYHSFSPWQHIPCQNELDSVGGRVTKPVNGCGVPGFHHKRHYSVCKLICAAISTST